MAAYLSPAFWRTPSWKKRSCVSLKTCPASRASLRISSRRRSNICIRKSPLRWLLASGNFPCPSRRAILRRAFDLSIVMIPNDIEFMQLALTAARDGARRGEVPVGAVIVRGGGGVGVGTKFRRALQNPPRPPEKDAPPAASPRPRQRPVELVG